MSRHAYLSLLGFLARHHPRNWATPKACGWGTVTILVLGAAALSFSQIFQGQGDHTSQNKSAEASQAAWLSQLKTQAPELYQFERDLFRLRKASQRIIHDYVLNRIDKNTAREQLLPLLQEERSIVNDPQYEVEQILFMARQPIPGANQAK